MPELSDLEESPATNFVPEKTPNTNPVKITNKPIRKKCKYEISDSSSDENQDNVETPFSKLSWIGCLDQSKVKKFKWSRKKPKYESRTKHTFLKF